MKVKHKKVVKTRTYFRFNKEELWVLVEALENYGKNSLTPYYSELASNMSKQARSNSS